MDFKALVSKIASFETPVKTLEKAPEAPKVQLSEDAELRVLAGVSSILTEAKKVSEAEHKDKDSFDKNAKTGDTYKTKTGTVTKTDKGVKHEKSYKDDKKDVDESMEEDLDTVYEETVTEKKKPSAGLTKKQKSDTVKAAKAGKDIGKPGKSFDKVAKAAGGGEKGKKIAAAAMWKNKAKSVKEAAKPDFLDLDKDGNKKEPMKSAAKSKGGDSKEGGKKGMSPAQAKFFGKKKAVKESVERLTFGRALQIVKESQGTMQIDPVDSALWNWANRVGTSKFTESAKAQAFAAATYEKMGGEWDLHKIVTE
jgi:hypothetical protein